MIKRIIAYLKSDGMVIFAIAALLAVLLLSVTGCTKTVYVPTETIRTEYRTDTLKQVLLRTDSIYHRDSIYFEGETIIKERWRERYVYRTDTLYKAKVDTAYQFREVTKLIEVEKKMHWYEKTAMYLGYIAVGVLLGLGLILYLKKKFF